MSEQDALVERVAEAMWASEQEAIQRIDEEGGVFEAIHRTWDEASERERGWWLRRGRAALDVVRAFMLSDEQVNDAVEEWNYTVYRTTDSDAIVRAIIKAALGEGDDDRD